MSDKNFKIVGLRPSKIGDIITSLPILYLLEKKYPGSYKTVSIAKKCAQCVPLLLNQPLIDKLHINEILEKPNDIDINFYNSHDLVIPPNLQHLDPFWYNRYSMVEENFRMMGFNWNELEPELRIPKLIKWFDLPKKINNTIAIWPMAGNGQDKRRSPTQEWYWKLVDLIEKETKYKVLQFGHPDDFNIATSYQDCRSLDFFEQIKLTLGCSLMIGTDAGSSLIMGAYEFPQITLLTNWQTNHTSNFHSLEPMNKNNISLFAYGQCDNIPQEAVIETIKGI